MSANASVVVTSMSSEATYSGTVAAYNFEPAPPYVNGAAVARDASREHLPEPATWAMMILGFFGLSFAVRGRTTRKPRARVRYS
ncbi:MAG: PEP-CTERM sorting domain-containing protein [Sphingomonas sp.]|nr:PEP-CTERM sorting domain-containing protein [Sphingomonas sp.]